MTTIKLDKSYRLMWLWAVFLLLGILIGVGVGLVAAARDMTQGGLVLVLVGTVIVYGGVGFWVLALLRVGMHWHLELINSDRIVIELTLRVSPVPPWTAYRVEVDGRHKFTQRASWRSVDRWEMDSAGDPPHRLGLTVKGGSLWPVSPIRLALELDGLDVVDV